MTPQELMDLPYAGMAEKQLRRLGKWRLTELEKLEAKWEKCMDSLYDIKCIAEEHV